MKYLSAEEIMKSFRDKFADDLIEEPYIKTFKNGVKRTPYSQIFIRVNRERFVEAGEHLTSFEWPHHTVA